MAVNARRGEVAATLAGREVRLCLTLGALAELESAFAVADVAALGRRFEGGRLATGDLLKLLAAGLRGGGETIAPAELDALPAAALPEVAGAVTAMLLATFGDPGANPP